MVLLNYKPQLKKGSCKMSELTKYITIDALLDAWKNDFQDNIKLFIRDGIISEADYAHPHILFIMREMNTDKEDNLREDLYNRGSGWKTWNNAARWATALLTGSEYYPRDINRRDQMRKVAVINLKKEAGGARANKQELKAAVSADGSYTLREIELCDPEIIICGGFGNADLLKEHVFKELAGEWKELPAVSFDSTWWYYFATINGKDIPVISFCHPQVTNFKGKRGHNELFEPLYREMLNIRKEFLKS